MTRLRFFPLPILALILAVTTPLAARGQKAEDGETADATENEQTERSPDPDVIAWINDEALYVEDVSSVLGVIHDSVRPEDRADFDLEQLIFRLVNDTLLAQEARALGMREDPAIDRKLEARRVKLATDRLGREEILDQIHLDAEALARVYEDLFRKLTLSIATRRERSEAEEMLRELQDGADFEAMARERSQDFYAARGGLAERVVKVDLPTDLGELVVSLEPGELVGPVATRHGWSILRLESIEPADPEEFEDRKRAVRAELQYEQKNALRSQLLDRLRADHEVIAHRDVYDGIGIQTMPDGRLLPQIDDPEAVVVEAGGQPVTAASFGQALAARWAGVVNPDVAQAIKPIVLDGLTVDALLTAEALRRGYDQSPEVEREVHALETRLLVSRYLEEVLAPQATVTREEIETYFEEHREEFRKPPLLYVSQLTVTTEEEGQRLAELVRGGTDFSWLARQHSTDRLRDAGGVVGWVEANKGVSGFRTELATAQAGDVFGPSGRGEDWRLIYVGALEEQGMYSLNQVSGNVRTRLEDRKTFEIIDAFIQTLRGRSEILINEEAIAALQITGAPKPETAEGMAPGHGGG